MKVVRFEDPKSHMPCCAIEGPRGKLAVFKLFAGEWIDVSKVVVPGNMCMSPLELLACTAILPETTGALDDV